MTAPAACAVEPGQLYETFEPNNFDRPTNIDNQWFPLKPGMQYKWDGTTINDEGDEEPHQIIFTVTDLTKVIDGVRTIVCWDRDYADGELEEAEIVFFAQDNNGNVWHFGQYPEEYDEGKLLAAPCWIHGISDGKAGIMMKTKPKLGTPSYSQGLSLSTNWTDRAVVYQVGQKTEVPFGSFEGVLVIEESDSEEPEARQLKYYAPGVGNVRVGWRGDASGAETLELIEVRQLDEKEFAEVRAEVLDLEKRAYHHSKDIYSQTKPIEPINSADAGK